MRIISGAARGQKLVTPPAKNISIRPTADRAREALFSILAQRVPDSVVLDLFAGTGALGFEALSRGSRQVVLIDNGHTSLDILKKNGTIFSRNTEVDNDFFIIKDDLSRPGFTKKIPPLIKFPFDIIFIDPPYGKNLSVPIVEYICNKGLLAIDGIVIVEERFNIILPAKISDLHLLDSRIYGETGFSFYQHPAVIDNCEGDILISIEDDIKGTSQ